MTDAEKNNATLTKDEIEEEKRIRAFLLSIGIFISTINNVSTFNNAITQINFQIDNYIVGYKRLIEKTMLDEVIRLAPNLSSTQAQSIVTEAFAKEYIIKGTTNKITLDGILMRRGFKLKADIQSSILTKNGFQTPSQATINKIVKEVLQKNQKSLAQIISNETHKAQQKAIVLSGKQNIADGINKVNQKVFVYQTQMDDRVRPSHAQYQGQELTVSEANDLANSVMSQPNCRCSLVEL